LYVPPTPSVLLFSRALPLLSTGYTNDLYAFDAATLLWTRLRPDAPPSPRAYHGLAAAAGRLYVFAGQDNNGTPLSSDGADRDSDRGSDRDSDRDLAGW
jgi:hypothetical protein